MKWSRNLAQLAYLVNCCVTFSMLWSAQHKTCFLLHPKDWQHQHHTALNKYTLNYETWNKQHTRLESPHGHHTWLFEWIFKNIQPIKPQDLIAVLVINQWQLWRVHLDIHCSLSMAGVITLDTLPPFQQFAADWVKHIQSESRKIKHKRN